MRFVLAYPEVNGTEADLLDAGDVGELASAAEAAGFAGFAFTEHPIPACEVASSEAGTNPLVHMALAFAATAPNDSSC